jgi:hypothetical protein
MEKWSSHKMFIQWIVENLFFVNTTLRFVAYLSNCPPYSQRHNINTHQSQADWTVHEDCPIIFNTSPQSNQQCLIGAMHEKET